MTKSFDELIAKLDGCPLKKVSVAVAQDAPVLEAIKVAKERNIADAILVGDEKLFPLSMKEKRICT